MIVKLDNLSEQSEYLNFRNAGKPNPKATTRVFFVVSRISGVLLGQIRWYSNWRQYTFMPVTNIVLDKKCLTDLAEYCTLKTDEHKNNRLIPMSVTSLTV